MVKNGMVSDVMIWNRVLSPKEVAALYKNRINEL